METITSNIGRALYRLFLLFLMAVCLVIGLAQFGLIRDAQAHSYHGGYHYYPYVYRPYVYRPQVYHPRHTYWVAPLVVGGAAAGAYAYSNPPTYIYTQPYPALPIVAGEAESTPVTYICPSNGLTFPQVATCDQAWWVQRAP